MRRKWLACLCALMILTGCGQAETTFAEKAPYWTLDVEGGQVFLRDSAESQGTLELVLRCDEKETVLQTLTGARESDVSAEPFTDILAWDGFRLTERQGLAVEHPEEDWSIRTYYMVEDGVSREIAESFGWGAPQDYSVDLNGDGAKELVSNVVYGGDGHQDAYIYQRQGDDVLRGSVSTEDLPEHDNWGVNSTSTVYDPARNVFQVKYSVKNQTEPGLLETTGLERIEFSPYEAER